MLQKNTQREIGCKMKQLRQEKKMTQAEMAEMMNVSTSAVSKWERGLNGVDIHTACELAKIFEIPVSELMDGYWIDKGEPEEQESQKDTEIQQGIHKFRRVWIGAGGCILVIIIFLCLFFYHRQNDKFTAKVVDEFFVNKSEQLDNKAVYYIIIEYQGKYPEAGSIIHLDDIETENLQYFENAALVHISYWEHYLGREHIGEAENYCIFNLEKPEDTNGM